MSQDLSKTINTKNGVKRAAGTVLPKEDTIVYSGSALSGIMPVGTKMTVHAEVAKKLLASGKVTKTEPDPETKETKGGKSKDDKGGDAK